MATVSGNIITSGLRGKIGELLVFRVLRGKTVVSRVAPKPDKSKETAAQRATRTMFREASQWARTTLRNPAERLHYLQRARVEKLPNAYTAAVKDYMRSRKSKVVREEVVLAPVPQFAYRLKTDLSPPTTKEYVIRKPHALSLVGYNSLPGIEKCIAQIEQTKTREQKTTKFSSPFRPSFQR